jgi:hypothetical protein
MEDTMDQYYFDQLNEAIARVLERCKPLLELPQFMISFSHNEVTLQQRNAIADLRYACEELLDEIWD